MLHDILTKRERGYVERDSKVLYDGAETLVRRDWKRRKEELAERSGGRCEQVTKGERCRKMATEAHHVKARSKGRDDRITNLLHLCHDCHQALDWKRLHWTRRASGGD